MMFGIPLEVFTGLASAAFGGIMQLWSEASKAKQAHRAHELAIMAEKSGAIRSAREYAGPAKPNGWHWTRRTITLMVVFFVICWPKIIAVFSDVPVAVSYTVLRPGFWLLPAHDAVEWVVMTGLVITPLDTHVTLAIAGMLFGSEIVRRR